jgi:hypothetical protein
VLCWEQASSQGTREPVCAVSNNTHLFVKSALKNNKEAISCIVLIYFRELLFGTDIPCIIFSSLKAVLKLFSMRPFLVMIVKILVYDV